MVTLDLLFGSTNPGKLKELRRLVADLPLRVLSPDELGRPLPEVAEDGATFEENAAKKAIAWARFAGIPAVADDSGLCVDFLRGEPGVRSARWSEQAHPGALPRDVRDEANNDLLLARLAGVEEAARGAEYRAALVLATPDGRVVATVLGVCRGRIMEARRGHEGFGYDPVFLPLAHPSRTMAELEPASKDAISHRGEAFRRLLPYLSALCSRAGRSGP